jgi:hypothetical protein
MKTRLPCLLLTLCISLSALSSHAELYKVGDSFIGFTVTDNRGKTNVFKAGDAKFIVFDTPTEQGSAEHPADPDFFSKNHARLLINISGFSYFKRKIARSRMESKPMELQIVDDKAVAEQFPIEKEKFTVLALDDQGKITAIEFAAPGPELKKIITGE